jgi:diguanylate cyclase (GGDEF)-like protein
MSVMRAAIHHALVRITAEIASAHDRSREARPVRLSVVGRAAALLLSHPTPDLRFDVQRSRDVRTFVAIILGIQAAYAVVGLLVGRANALATDPTVALVSAAVVVGVSGLLFVALMRARAPLTIEIVSFVAGALSLGESLMGQLDNPASTLAVATYEAIAIAIVAYAVPWRPITHYAWVTIAAVAAFVGLSSVAAGDLRNALAGAVAFALVVSLIGKPLIWNARVESYQRLKQVRRLNATLYRLSRRDSPTGVGNRTALDAHIARLAARPAGDVGFAMVDIDDFKVLNDTFGHAAGDGTLRHVAEIVRQSVRDTDRVFRYGGEEFLVVFERASAAGLVTAADRIRAAVERAAIAADDSGTRPLTVSIGVADAQLPTDVAGLEATINSADFFMYQAKRAGKNRVEPTAR